VHRMKCVEAYLKKYYSSAGMGTATSAIVRNWRPSKTFLDWDKIERDPETIVFFDDFKQ